MVDSNYNYKLSTNAKTLLNTNISSIQLTTDQLSKMTCSSRIILSDIQQRALNTQITGTDISIDNSAPLSNTITLNSTQLPLTTVNVPNTVRVSLTDTDIVNIIKSGSQLIPANQFIPPIFSSTTINFTPAQITMISGNTFNSIQLSSKQKKSLSTQIGTLDLHAYQIFPWNNIIMTPNQTQLLNTANNTLRIDYPTFNTVTNSDITCKMMIITGRANETKLITDTYLSADDLICKKMQDIKDMYNSILNQYNNFSTQIDYVELPSI